MKTKSKQIKKNSPSRRFREFGLLALFLFLLWMFFGGSALAQTVSISPMGTNYGKKTVKFQVTFEGTTTPAGKVWVWIDYCSVTAGAHGSFSPATISSATVTTGSGSTEAGGLPGRGFYVTASPAIVEATLGGAPNQWNWCAYGSGYAPAAELQADGSYKLTGAPPFIINGTKLGDGVTTFGAGACIASLTDATGHPDAIIPDKPVVASVSASTPCAGNTASLTATLSGGTTTAMIYTWNIGGTSSTTSVNTKTSQTLSGNTTYSVTATNANGCTSAVSNTGTITVRPAFTSGTISSTGQTICDGGSVNTIGNTTAASGGDNTISYQWYRNGDAIPGATATTYAPTAYASTFGAQTFTRRTKDGTCNTTLTASTGQWVLTVLADPTVSVTAAQSICYNTAPTAMTATYSGGTGTVSYQWQSGAATASMSNISGATASTYASGALTATTYYRVLITQTGSGCAATATAIAKTVYSQFSAGAISGNSTICVGGTPSAIAAGTTASGGNGATTYQWYRNGSIISGATATAYTPPTSHATATGGNTYTRRAKSASCPEATASGSYLLTVLADPTVSVTAAQSICYNTAPTAMTATPSGGTGTVSYQWQSGAATTSMSNISDATNATYAPGALATTTYYRVLITQTGSGCAATATAIAKTVYSQFSAGAISGSSTICVGGTPSAIAAGTTASGGNGATTYQWYRNGSIISGATTTAYTPPTSHATATGGNTYTRRAKSASCPEATASGSYVLTVLADPTVTITAAQTICNGAAGSALTATPSGGSGSNTYTWQWGTTTACSDGSSTSTANTLATGNLTANRYYRVMVTQSVSGCASAYSAAVLKTVRTAFSVGAIATTGQTICSGGAVTTIGNTTAASGGDGAISYQWYRNGSAITGATATTYAPTAYASTVGAQTFTRRAKDGTCNTALTASTGQWVLTVRAKPTITYLSSGSTAQTVTANSAISAIKYTTANATGASISGQPAGVSGAWASNTYTVSGTPTAAGTFTYTVTTTNSNGCTNVSATGKITVLPGITYTNCTTPTLILGTVSFANSATYTRNGITFSAPVTASGCNKTSYAGGSSGAYNADCRTNPGYDGDLFSWCMVKQYESQLCPSPWRVPTTENFMMYANASTSDSGGTTAITAGMHGWAGGTNIPGDNGTLVAEPYGIYWSITENSDTNSYGARSRMLGFDPQLDANKIWGFALRCVK